MTVTEIGVAAYTADGQTVPRERFYAIACDPQRSVVVEACAGAGKTWMLVSRILRALLEGAEPQEIVAITFTRKAAGEMRERLGQWLEEFARASDEARVDALLQRGMSAAQARALAPTLAALRQRLLQGGRGVEIRTFHAWFSQLLRAAPLELLEAQGLSPELQLVEDDAELAPELWPRFHAAVLAEPELLAAYRELTSAYGRRRLQSWLEAAFDKRVELRLAQQAGHLLDSVPDAVSVSPRFAGLSHPVEAFEVLRPALWALAGALGAAKGATPRKAAAAIEAALGQGDAEAAFRGVFAALFTATGTPRKNMGEGADLEAALVELELLSRALAQHQACRSHRLMCGLALCLLEQYEQLKRSRGLVDMNDLERGALALLGDPALSGWVQQRLDAQVRHLLIDEFQDTSPLQWHALYAWLASYGGAGGGGQRAPSVFIVGDPKQSIYRFRRAEPRVFAAASDFVRDGLQGALLACDHTRRNAPPVLAAVNAAFDSASRAGEYSGFRPHTTEASAGSALDPLAGVFWLEDAGVEPKTAAEDADDAAQLWRPSLTQARHEPELQRRAAEAARIAACIAALVQEGQALPGEIFVLARKRDGLRVLAQTLKNLGIAHAAPEDTPLLDSPDVRDLLALLDVLASPGHNLSLAHALRSPLFGAGESDLLLLAEHAASVQWLGRPQAESSQSWWAALMLVDPALLSPALLRARGLLARWQDLARLRSPHDLLDAVVFEGELLQRLAAAVPPSERRSRLHAVEALLALSLDLDGGRHAGVYSFVRALKTRALKLAWPSQGEAVQLLTVHGAKGLEARVVFLMDCEAGPARAESNSLAVAWAVQDASPGAVAFLASESRPPPSLQALLDEEREQRQREELNALYVAMTRARARLVLSRTPARSKSAASTWWTRLQPLGLSLAVPQAGGALLADEAFALRSLPVAPRAESLSAEIGCAPEPVDDSAALGEALHRVLEWACGPRGQDLPQLLASAAQMYGLDAARSERLERSAAAILDSAECAPFFDPQRLHWAGNEVAISLGGQELRIDRLVCMKGSEQGEAPVWWVLDYKLHAAPQQQPEYLEQLSRYRRAVLALQPGESVRTAFITGQGRLIDCSEQVERIFASDLSGKA